MKEAARHPGTDAGIHQAVRDWGRGQGRVRMEKSVVERDEDGNGRIESRVP